MLVWIGQYWFGSVNICLNSLISVWIGYYRSRSVNIRLDRLNVKKYWVNIDKDGLISVKMLTNTWIR